MIVIGGENLIDLVSSSSNSEGLPIYLANPGGSPYNVAIATSKLGAKVSYLTPLSKDTLGKLLSSKLKESGVKILSKSISNPTSLAVVSIKNGFPSYSFHRNDTAERKVNLENLLDILPINAKIFHVGSLGLIEGQDAEVWEKFFKICKQKGLITSLDPNVRPILIRDRKNYIKRLERMFFDVDILKLSNEDLQWIYPSKSLDQSFEILQSKTKAQLLILTLGEEGSIGKTSNFEVKISSKKISDLRDTVGAGDTYMASILNWFVDHKIYNINLVKNLKKPDLSSMMDKASIAAALNCKKIGCNPPSREDIEIFINKENFENNA